MLIIDMPMPKDCPMCPMAHYNKLDEFTGCEVAVGKLFAATRDKAYAESTSRPSWCPIKGTLPEEHGDLIDGDLAKARIHKNIIDYYENASGGYYLAEDAEEEVGLMVEYETIIPATERSER